MGHSYKATSSGFVSKTKQEGFFSKGDLIHKSRFFFGKATFPSGHVDKGKWQYIYELKAFWLVDGKTTWPDGTVQEGKQEYIPVLKGLALVDREVTRSNGQIKKGKFGWNSELKVMDLVPSDI